MASHEKIEVAIISAAICSMINHSKETIRYGCGHVYAKYFELNLFGETMKMQEAFLAQAMMCGECALTNHIAPFTKRCAQCGFAIVKDDAVSTSTTSAEGIKIEDLAKHGGSFLTCNRKNCCARQEHLAGHWNGTRFVPNFGDPESGNYDITQWGAEYGNQRQRGGCGD